MFNCSRYVSSFRSDKERNCMFFKFWWRLL